MGDACCCRMSTNTDVRLVPYGACSCVLKPPFLKYKQEFDVCRDRSVDVFMFREVQTSNMMNYMTVFITQSKQGVDVGQIT